MDCYFSFHTDSHFKGSNPFILFAQQVINPS